MKLPWTYAHNMGGMNSLNLFVNIITLDILLIFLFIDRYARLETVELILAKRPELIRSYNSRAAGIMFAHTPLHLASRNGHKYVNVISDANF